MRILPPLPANAQQVSSAGSGGPGNTGRVLAAQIIAPLAGELYQARAGQMILAVRSTIPLLRGQPVQLQLQQPGAGQPAAWTVVVDDSGEQPALPDSPSRTNNTGTTTALLRAAAPTGQPLTQPRPAAAATVTLATGMAAPASASVPPATVAGRPALPATSADGRPQTLPPAIGRPAGAAISAFAANGRVAATATAAPPIAPAGRSPAPTAEVRQHLQTTLPRQQDPTRLLAVLQTLRPLLEQPAETASPLRAAAAGLLAALPEAAALTTPEAVAGALRQSGLLHESAAPAGGDLKLALQQLVAAGGDSLPPPRLEPGAPAGQVHPLPRRAEEITDAVADNRPLLLQLAAEAEPVLSRLETHQLMHLQQDGPLQQWLFELPLRCQDGIDLWQLHVEKDAQRAAAQPMAADSAWALTLSVDFPETGALVIRLGLQDGQLQARFHAEQAQTHARIQALLPDLAERLSAQGLAAPQLSCQRGLPHPDNLPAPPRPVLEITA